MKSNRKTATKWLFRAAIVSAVFGGLALQGIDLTGGQAVTIGLGFAATEALVIWEDSNTTTTQENNRRNQ